MSLSTSDFNRIMRDYDQRRAHNTQEQKKHQEEAFDRIPRLRDIHNRVGRVGIEMIQATMKEPHRKEEFDQELKDRLQALRLQKEQLLTAHGYPKNYLEPIYDCEDCEDTGYIGHEKCHCLKQAIINYSYSQSNLSDVLALENFDTFRFDYYSTETNPQTGMSPMENMRSVYHACQTFVDEFDDTFNNLILYGRSGLGKTFLCNSIAKALLDSGKTVVYLSAFQLFRLFENYRFHKDEEIVTNEDIEALFTVDLLIIDDLGTEFVNSLTSAELFNCLNTRLLHNRSTVVSTNLNPNEWVDKYSERIVSRIFGYYTQLKFFGSDIRLQKYR